MSLTAKFKTFFSNPTAIRIVVAILLLVAAAAILQVAALAWKGSHVRRVISEKPRVEISIKKPYPRLAVAAFCLLLAYAVSRGRHHTARDWGRFAGRLILLLVSLGLSMLLAEITLRAILLKHQEANSLANLVKRGEQPGKVRGTHPLIAIIQPSTNETMVYELKPNMEMEFGHRILRTNRHGMRNDMDYSFERSTNSVRILGVGDSGLFGWDMHQGNDYLSVLASNLNARADGVRYEALNYGIPGYNTAQEVELLAVRGLPFQPDIVIIAWNVNDFDIPFCVVQKANFARRDISFLHLLLFDRSEGFRKACFSGVADNRTRDLNHVPKGLIEMSGGEGVRYAMKRALELSRQNNFHILVFGVMDANIRNICGEIGIPFYNTAEKVDSSKHPREYGIHALHPREGGHRVLAEHLEEYLRQQGWLTPRPAPTP